MPLRFSSPCNVRKSRSCYLPITTASWRPMCFNWLRGTCKGVPAASRTSPCFVASRFWSSNHVVHKSWIGGPRWNRYWRPTLVRLPPRFPLPGPRPQAADMPCCLCQPHRCARHRGARLAEGLFSAAQRGTSDRAPTMEVPLFRHVRSSRCWANRLQPVPSISRFRSGPVSSVARHCHAPLDLTQTMAERIIPMFEEPRSKLSMQ